jgi:hypothetical protein
MTVKGSFLVPLLTVFAALVCTQAASAQSQPRPAQKLPPQPWAAARAANAAKVAQVLAAQEQLRQQTQLQLAASQAVKTQQLLNLIGAPAPQTRSISSTTATVQPGALVRAPSISNPITGPGQLTPPGGTPVISSVTPGEGQPGDPVLITGTSFGVCVSVGPCAGGFGEVHFVINPGVDLPAPVVMWTSTRILVHVPAASGIQRYAGSVYVTLGGSHQASAPQQFIFDPLLDTQTIEVTPSVKDQNVAGPSEGCLYWYNGPYNWPVSEPIPYCTAIHANELGLPGAFSGDDVWYATTSLKNGWIVESRNDVDYHDNSSITGGYSSITGAARPGTPSLYTKVHWSENGGPSYDWYDLLITIKGPKGTSPF